MGVDYLLLIIVLLYLSLDGIGNLPEVKKVMLLVFGAGGCNLF